jgi:hypothetical protein
MNRALVERITNAVLYEGYILYPYRPSVKNCQRWTFGGLYPEAYCQAQSGADAPSNQTECLVEGNSETALAVTVRFLHLTERIVGEVGPPLKEWPTAPEPAFRPVETMRIGDRVFHSWQEAEERRIDLTGLSLGQILQEIHRKRFVFSSRRWLEPLSGPNGKICGVLMRQQQAIEGTVEVGAIRIADGLSKVSVRVVNRTPLNETQSTIRDGALLRSFVSTHTILGVHEGEFVSLLDPPEVWRDAAADCRNVGTWPVLVGEIGARDTMLSSPIILYDYPQVAPESQGDLFDGTEIDEILTLRILTLTDEEKRTAAAVEGRVRDMLARTESLARDELLALHGRVRGLRQV